MKIKNTSLKIASVVTSLVLAASPMIAMANAQDYTTQHYTANQVSVSISDTGYSPQTLHIQAGTTVVWRNYGNMPHTVTFNNYSLNSGTISPGSSFSHTFTTSGTWNYYCQFHPSMTGSVVVSGQSNPGGQAAYPNNQLSGRVVGSSQGQGQIIINNITAVKTTGVADGTFPSGWQWVFDISVPSHETNLAMRFNNWIMHNSGHVMPVANNMRFYSSQSSNAQNQGSAIYITAAGVYSQSMFLTGSLSNAPSGMRRVQITVETRIPTGTPTGTYTTDFGIRTQ